jgi:hypothetical protein
MDFLLSLNFAQKLQKFIAWVSDRRDDGGGMNIVSEITACVSV